MHPLNTYFQLYEPLTGLILNIFCGLLLFLLQLLSLFYFIFITTLLFSAIVAAVFHFCITIAVVVVALFC